MNFQDVFIMINYVMFLKAQIWNRKCREACMKLYECRESWRKCNKEE